MSTAHPTVSVIMPVYHVEQYVAQAVQSVLDQSYQDFELIIVDDGGTDHSVAICREFTDPRIRIISQVNHGLAGARNTGIAAARGHLVALLDSDDIWAPGKLAAHVAHLNANPDVGASYSAAELIDEHGHSLGIFQRPKRGAVSAREVFCGQAICNGSTPVFRLEMLHDSVIHHDHSGRAWYFTETLRRSEDVECWTRLALRSQLRFEVIDDVLTYYRVNSAGLSADVIRQLNSWDQMCADIEAFAPDFIAAHRNEGRARELRYLARRCVFMRDRRLGLMLITQALTTCPRLMWQEPVKSGVTLAACLALRVLPQSYFNRLLRVAQDALGLFRRSFG
ncbi:MAG: hypothetical protein B7Z75_01670 [Acidocella sp. 20-57-95]|nr:MAG: hypothetical protein B7Z75_01670 [Acidocella sp. 20-57-95]OYV62372.1 MAG: hypothetical protein B7Z71_01470 [Acidocella sp. 21-58-7]HQT63707.1 glycosyltransferase family A protein [Acidocella sp.]HQU03906.1 glycosyltransferase family A protein [Acidocella sp.]